MRFDIDWPYMRPALLVLMVISVISVILLTASFSYLSEMEETYSAETGVRNEWREKYNTAKEDKRLIEQYLAAYTQMEQDGIARDEQRLDWVDTLRARVKEMKLPNVRYQIKPQEPFTAAYLETSPNLAVNVSRAKLEMELLHEVDLLSLINDLEMKVPGIFHVDRCELRRHGAEFSYRLESPNLQATCELLWFTIQPTSAHERDAI